MLKKILYPAVVLIIEMTYFVVAHINALSLRGGKDRA
jgi:hypothetical protein